MSRSALAQRFTDLVGMPPMHYLTRWRLGLAQIAASVGYDSEAAFNRAFKRAYGCAPGLWRRRAGGLIPRAAPSLA